ncbi:hypothetical protein [Methylicorpusculum sp.]|uniref:hypothetical protein n=1 Tax=Methylicorpusculum sp. TaxID=2713644 RepID=UPI00272B7215|nr:hypothetical protein [Methylicorpusculum sp.]MDP2179333.1 hypothetical protein [Methylicorpusculum sp.]MDP3529574.1 hypothetical protein [Methylicorpusculum sp.]
MPTLLNTLEKEEFAAQLRAHFAQIRNELIRESQLHNGPEEAQNQHDSEYDGCLDLLFDLNFGLVDLAESSPDLQGVSPLFSELSRKNNGKGSLI